MVLTVTPFGMDKYMQPPQKWEREKLSYFADHTSVHGWPRVLSNNNVQYKLLWLSLCLISTGMFLFQAFELLYNYFQFPTQTTVEVYGPIEQFPSITFCNLQHIDPVLHYLVVKQINGDLENVCDNKTGSHEEFLCKLKKKYKPQIDTYNLLEKEYEYFSRNKTNKPHNIKYFLEDLGYKSDFFINSVRAKYFNRETFAANILKTGLSKPSQFGISLENFINQCYYSIYDCTPKRSSPSPWFKLVNTSDHFNCYTFNPNVFLQEVAEDKDARTQPIPGAQGGKINLVKYYQV